jgi:hypothetical protein
MAVISNLFVDAGSDYAVVLTAKTPGGQPINLTDYTVKSQMRKSFGSSVFVDLDAGVYNAARGQIVLRLSAADSETIEPGRWLYDVEITHPEGHKKRVVEGIVVVSPQITKT